MPVMNSTPTCSYYPLRDCSASASSSKRVRPKFGIKGVDIDQPRTLRLQNWRHFELTLCQSSWQTVNTRNVPLLHLYSGNFTFINLFGIKFSCFASPPLQCYGNLTFYCCKQRSCFLWNQYSFKWNHYLKVRVTRFEFEVEVILNIAYCSWYHLSWVSPEQCSVWMERNASWTLSRGCSQSPLSSRVAALIPRLRSPVFLSPRKFVTVLWQPRSLEKS